MKIAGISIPFTKADNLDKPEPPRAKVITQVVERQLIRQKQDIKNWRQATQIAERKEINPDRTELIRIYKDVALDPHFCALHSSTVNGCLAANYWLEDQEGNKNDEATVKIQTAWFREFLTYAIDSKFYGHSLVQMGPIKNDEFTEIKLIPREYVIPNIHVVKKELHVTQGNAGNFIDYTLPIYKPWIIELGKREDLGLLHKATPWVLWKKNVTIAWAQYAELFGMPTRVGKTDIRDPEKLANMDNMLKNMGSAAYGIFDPDDLLEFVEGKVGDSYHVYFEFMNFANEELSKLILGQTMTTEDGSSRSQSEVHERVMNTYTSSLKWFLRDMVQRKLLPLLQFHNLIPEGLTFVWDNEEKVSLSEKFKQVIELKRSGYSVPADFINETFNIPVEEAPPGLPINEPPVMNVINKALDFYKGWTPGHVHKYGQNGE